MSFSAHSAFLCDRLLNMFCSAAYKLAPPFGHITVELCPGLESNSWTKSAKPQCLCGIILFVLLYRNHRCGEQFRLLSYLKFSFVQQNDLPCYCLHGEGNYSAGKQISDPKFFFRNLYKKQIQSLLRSDLFCLSKIILLFQHLARLKQFFVHGIIFFMQ